MASLEGTGSLSMQPVGCKPWCSTYAAVVVEQIRGGSWGEVVWER